MGNFVPSYGNVFVNTAQVPPFGNSDQLRGIFPAVRLAHADETNGTWRLLVCSTALESRTANLPSKTPPTAGTHAWVNNTAALNLELGLLLSFRLPCPVFRTVFDPTGNNFALHLETILIPSFTNGILVCSATLATWTVITGCIRRKPRFSSVCIPEHQSTVPGPGVAAGRRPLYPNLADGAAGKMQQTPPITHSSSQAKSALERFFPCSDRLHVFSFNRRRKSSSPQKRTLARDCSNLD